MSEEKDHKDGEGIVVGPPVTDKPVEENKDPKPNPDKPVEGDKDKDDDPLDFPNGGGNNGIFK